MRQFKTPDLDQQKSNFTSFQINRSLRDSIIINWFILFAHNNKLQCIYIIRLLFSRRRVKILIMNSVVEKHLKHCVHAVVGMFIIATPRVWSSLEYSLTFTSFSFHGLSSILLVKNCTKWQWAQSYIKYSSIPAQCFYFQA